jgi:hypothetical protein
MRLNRLALVLVLPAAALADGAPAVQPAKPAAQAGKVAVEQFFKGRIQKLEGREIELVYDFENATQLDDFEISIPFRAVRTVARAIEGGRLHVTGTGSVRHKAVFDKTVGASVTLTPAKNRDFGLAVTEERESEVFTLYCLYDRYFGLGDNVHVPQNMVIKFIPRDPKANKEGQQDWRYCGSRGQQPEIERGRPYKVEIARGDNKSKFVIGEWSSEGKEASRDLLTQMVALYGYEGDFRADDFVVRGSLDAAFVERNKIDLATWKPPAAQGPKAVAGVAPEVAERVRARIAGWPAETKAPEMAALLRDATLPAELRGEAAQRAIEAGVKKLVPYLVDGLYADDETARKLSNEALTKLAGRSFGFRADAPAEQRKKAIQSVNEYLQKHATEFQ